MESNPVMNVAASSIAHKPFSRRQSISLVLGCTVLGAAAQILMKFGANALTPGIIGIITNVPLMTGYCLYGISTVLLVLALRDGELSILYPVIALTYVWVTVLSVFVFHDTMNVWKVLGVTTIVCGVTLLGAGGK
jgi:multidrug transporter EmrE-like cation transporter